MKPNMHFNQQSPATVRVLGVVLIVIGMILGSAAAWAVLRISGALGESPVVILGTSAQRTLIQLVLWALGAFGLFAFACGMFQTATGRRSRALTEALFFLFVALMVLIAVVTIFA